LGTPPDALIDPLRIEHLLGAVRVLNSKLAPILSALVFVKTVDGRLWMSVSQGAGRTWAGMPGRADAPVGAVAVDDVPEGTRPYVFVLLDGKLQLYWWRRDGEWVSTDLGTPGTPLSEGIGAVSLTLNPQSGPQPVVIVRGQSGDLWTGWWDPTSGPGVWRWANLGRPALAYLWKLGAVAVRDPQTNTERLHVYVTGDDGNLWDCVWNLDEKQWVNLGRPPVPMSGTAGVTAVRNPGDKAARIYALLTAWAQPLYVHLADAAGPRWLNAGTPAPSHVNVGLGTALVQPRAAGDFLPAALAGDDYGWVWAALENPATGWEWWSLGRPGEDVFASQQPAGVIIQEPPFTRTHTFLLTNGGDLYDAWYG
jgi:hypothetical protein